MHDPDVVAFTIPRPWPQKSTLPASQNGKRWAIRLHHDHHEDCPAEGCTEQPFPWWRPRSYSPFWRLAGRELYWPPLVTIWHREPGGADALSKCQHRWKDADGWHRSRGWRWHVRHWRIQIHPAQNFRRWALTRCAWCHGRSIKGDRVNCSRSWDGPRSRWWQGEPGLYHQGCLDIAVAHEACLCADPLTEHDYYGHCALCGKYRGYGRTEQQLDHLRGLAVIPAGQRTAHGAATEA